MRGKRNACKIVVRQPEWKRLLVDVVIDGRILLKWKLKQHNMKMCNRFIWLRVVIKGREARKQLRFVSLAVRP
jgi:hypothetical protein